MIRPLPGSRHGDLPRPAPRARDDTPAGEGFAAMLAARQLTTGHHPGVSGEPNWDPLREAQAGGVASPAELTEAVIDRFGDTASTADASAERFNEHGFFGAGSDAAETVQVAPGESHQEAAGQKAALPAGDSGQDVAEGLGFAGSPAEAVAPPSRQPAANLQAADQPAPLLAGAAMPPSARPVTTEQDIERPVESVPAARVARGMISHEGNRTALKVATRDAEQGIAVAVRGASLDDRDRERLRDEITAMLAQHGLRPGGIQINARAPSGAGGREN